MNKERLEKFCGEKTLTIVEAMERIDANASGILVIVEDGVLVGALSDGDIRRWLIKTGSLDVKVADIMNCNPKSLFKADWKNAQSFMRKNSIHALPIVDKNHHVTEILLDDDDFTLTQKTDALSAVPVIIMAGGKGTRLYPFTKILPKPLIPIGDMPIIEHIVKRFCDYGISEYYMTVNYKKGMIKSYFADLNPDYSITYVEEDKPLGTAGSIKLIDKKFETPVIVTNCDILINADYEEIYKYHKEYGNKMTIVSALKNVEVPYGVLHSSENGVVLGMEEKPKLSFFVNTGMYIVDADMLEKIPEDTFFHMTHLADMLMQEGLQVGMYPISEDSFLDMGEFEEMQRMEEKLGLN